MVEQAAGGFVVAQHGAAFLTVALRGEPLAVFERRLYPHPLPQLSAGKLGGGGVLDAARAHQHALAPVPRGEHAERDFERLAHVGQPQRAGVGQVGEAVVKVRWRVLVLALRRGVEAAPHRFEQFGEPGPRRREALCRLALLVGQHGVQCGLRVLRVGCEGRGAADCLGAVGAADPHQRFGVGPHGVHLHRELRARRHGRVPPRAQVLGQAEHVVPAPGVQAVGARRERLKDRFDVQQPAERLDLQAGLDRVGGETQMFLGEQQRVVPELRLGGRFQFGHVDVDGPFGARREHRAQVAQRGDGRSIKFQVRF